MPELSVIICAYNSDRGRLSRTFEGLAKQDLDAASWELLLVDNASTRPPVAPLSFPSSVRIVSEPEPGLTFARRAGVEAARADLIVFVDDDNVLDPDYLRKALALANAEPAVGLFGGPVSPEYEAPPPPWIAEFTGLLACRDLGTAPILSALGPGDGRARRSYPMAAPVGAGLVVRRAALRPWLDSLSKSGRAPTDRRGGDLSSAGDNDIVLHAARAGWLTGYFPSLHLTHLIPAARLQPAYLARLNRAIQRSWVRLLDLHEACPWTPIPRWTIPLRAARGWFVHRAWSSPAALIRWHGARGHFEGRAHLAP